MAFLGQNLGNNKFGGLKSILVVSDIIGRGKGEGGWQCIISFMFYVHIL